MIPPSPRFDSNDIIDIVGVGSETGGDGHRQGTKKHPPPPLPYGSHCGMNRWIVLQINSLYAQQSSKSYCMMINPTSRY